MFYSKRPILGITGRFCYVSVTPGFQFGYLGFRFSDKWQEIAISGIAPQKRAFHLEEGMKSGRIGCL